MNPEDNKQITIDDIDKTSDNNEIIQKWIEFFQSLSLVGDNIDDWNNFISKNSHTLYIEGQYYGMDKNNPFFKFIKSFMSVAGNNISTLSLLYGTLHNLVSRGTLSTKQIAFTCPEKEQVRILLNKSLYNNNQNDFCYLIKCYVWLLELDIKTGIKNKYISDNFQNTLKEKIKLIRLIYFSKALSTFMESDRDEKDTNDFIQELNKQVDSNFIISNPLLSCDDIEKNIKWLNDNVQESGRGINGKGQKADIDLAKQASQHNDNYYLSKGEKQVLINKLKPALETTVKNVNISGIDNVGDLINVIKNVL